ncbi:MAG: hypothetical protein E6Q67_00705 [Roseateles sp.]|nr:MAG: hypothetical protein E6Q67_00705 [Roseateles sp.]
MKKRIFIVALATLAMAAHASDKAIATAPHDAGLVESRQVQAGGDMPKPVCAQGLLPLVSIEMRKGTAAGAWSAFDRSTSAWQILFNGKAAPHKVEVKAYCMAGMAVAP